MQTTEFNTQAQCRADCRRRGFTPMETFRTCEQLAKLTGEPNTMKHPAQAGADKVKALFSKMVDDGFAHPSEFADFKKAFNNRTGQLKAQAPSRHKEPLANAFFLGLMLHNNPFKVGPGKMLCTQFFSTERAKEVLDMLIADGRGHVPTDLDPDANSLKAIFPEDFPA